uniref:Uracil phosphoribosyltransferase or UMP pyrophosphorylase n=1 Tax=Corallina ferreyrae TaxID=2547422 RepID=A0A482CDJ3_9FLOR|nr:uracil phosphoribosyltransferase or UMP pyrophosphorylase [Corallina ferreyrae]QBL75599.1 uracil phosphoribosyltransferase or UMP pyrophosphorylase [Corallina ferreyrae]
MKLNIHILSHPIIQYLSSITKEKNLQSNIKNHTLRQLGLFLLYETMRNWLTTHKLTIKTINEHKSITIIDTKESYTIITNTNTNLSLIQEIQCLLPKCDINFIPIKILDSTNISNLDQIIEIIHPYQKIIIISYNINTQYILKLMLYLTDIHNVKIQQIRLIAINCTTENLISISKIYPKLNVYTTGIENNETRR